MKEYLFMRHIWAVLLMMSVSITILAADPPADLPLRYNWKFGSAYPETTWETNGTIKENCIEFKKKESAESPEIDLSSCNNPFIEIKGSSNVRNLKIEECVDGVWRSIYFNQQGEIKYISTFADRLRISTTASYPTASVSEVLIWDYEDESTYYTVSDFSEKIHGIVHLSEDIAKDAIKNPTPEGWSLTNYDGTQPEIDESKYPRNGKYRADVIVSEILDLTSFTNPYLNLGKQLGSVEVSYDGINYEPFKTTDDSNPTPISKQIKRFKLSVPPLSLNGQKVELDRFEILDFGENVSIEIIKGYIYYYTSSYNFSGGKPFYSVAPVTDSTGNVTKQGYTLYYYDNIPSWVRSFNLSLPELASSDEFGANSIIKFNKIDGKWIKSNQLYPKAEAIALNVDGEAKLMHSISYINFNNNVKRPSLPKESSAKTHWYDLDGNGHLDLVTSSNIYLQSKHNLFATNSGKYFRALNGIADINGDGLPDIVTGEGVMPGNNEWTFQNIYNPKHFDPYTEPGDYFMVADADNDGSMELLYGCNRVVNGVQNSYLKFDEDLNAFSSRFVVFNAEQPEFKKGSYGEIGLPSVADGMFVGNGQYDRSASQCISLDITGDGLPEIITDKEILTDLGDGTYLHQPITGIITLRDFNNDGLLDYVANDQGGKRCVLYLVQPNGSRPQEVKLFEGIVANETIYCFDLDKDGDVDIVIPCDKRIGSHDNGAAYLIVMENLGNGKFKRHENYIEGDIRFHDCLDIDADGSYEILYTLLQTNDYPSKGYTKYVRLNGVKNISDSFDVMRAPIYTNHPILFAGPLAGNGYIYASSGESDLYLLSDKQNQRPSAPSKLEVSYDRSKSRLHITWGDGKDAESSVADLSYSLRIGTTPDGQEMMDADALADGTRRNLREGNMGHAHQRVLNVANWPKGKYYISVQTVDPNALGSSFSETVVFDKTDDAVGFDLYCPTPVNVGDILTVKTNNPNSNFDFGEDAVEIANDAEKRTRSFRYSTPGTKTVRLLGPGGSSRTIDVAPASIIPDTILLDKEIRYDTWISMVVDFDEDGQNEVFVRSNHQSQISALFSSLEKPNEFTQVKKIWNSNLPAKTDFFFGDYNRDGHADLFSKNTLIINEEDMNASVESIDAGYDVSNNAVDIDHDGEMEFYYYSYMYKYDKVTSSLKNIDLPGSILYDFNGDGFLDVLGKNINIYQGASNSFTFEKQEVSPDERTQKVCDFDNDGNPDFLCYNKDRFEPYIRWSDGTVTYLEGVNSIILGDLEIIDIDNDGLFDMVFWGELIGSSSTIPITGFQKPGRKFEFQAAYKENQKGSSDISPLMFRTANGTMRNRQGVFTGENTRPEAPTNLRATQDLLGLTIEWDDAHDKESHPRQMRYNISVKHKGMEGEGAYVISPFNGGKDYITAPQPGYYTRGNRYTVPLRVLPEGEYEIKVQAIDGWLETGPFSETLNVKVVWRTYLGMPASTRVGTPTEIINIYNIIDTPDFGEAKVINLSFASTDFRR